MLRALAVLLSLLIPIGCQSHSPDHRHARHHGDDDATRAGVIDTMQRYTDALLKKDIPALEQLWADDLVFINPRGQVQTKAQRLADIQSGATTFKSIDLQDVSVKTCGDAALHISRGKLAAQYSGQASSGEFRISVALCRHGDDWRIHAIQMTPIGR